MRKILSVLLAIILFSTFIYAEGEFASPSEIEIYERSGDVVIELYPSSDIIAKIGAGIAISYELDVRKNFGAWQSESATELMSGAVEIPVTRIVPNVNSYNEAFNLENDFYEFRLRYAMAGIKSGFGAVVSIGAMPVLENYSSWAAVELGKAMNYHIVPNEMTSDMKRSANRIEFAKALFRSYLIDNKLDASALKAIKPFVDTNDREVMLSRGLGLINGTSETTFAPNDKLERQQMAVLLHNLIKRQKPAILNGLSHSNTYSGVADYARVAVSDMVELGIIKGDGKGNIKPKDAATNEESILFLVRTIELLKK